MGRHKILTDEEAKRRSLAKIKEWKKKNPEKVKAQQKRYQERHKEEIKIYNHSRYKTMREKAALYDQMMAAN